MIRIFCWLLVLIVAVLIGIQLHQDPGYILVAHKKFAMELPLWFGVVSLIVIFLVLHLILRLIKATELLPTRIKAWFRNIKEKRAKRFTEKGLINLAEGNWRQAEKNLVHGVKNNPETTLINYLAAARASQEQGQDEKRDRYLLKAYENNPDAQIAVELTQAELQIHHHQLEQALATLKHLHELSPKHPYILKLLKNLYVQLKDWQSLEELLPQLVKRRVLSQNEIRGLYILTYRNLLQQTIYKDEIASEQVWQRVPRKFKHESKIVAAYVRTLLAHDKHDSAEALIRQTIKKSWDEELVRLYGKTYSSHLLKQQSVAEYWLKQHKGDANLYLTLGKLALKSQLWGKARNYLETSIELLPTPEAYFELGQWCEQQNQIMQAKAYYQKGLQLQVERLP